MGHRSRLTYGDEYDAFTGFRRLLAWRPGERRAIKQAHHQRERKRLRLALLAGLALAASVQGQGLLAATDDARWVRVGPLWVLAEEPIRPQRSSVFGVWPAPGVQAVRCDVPGVGTLDVDAGGARWTAAATSAVTRQPPVVRACDRCRGIPDLSLQVAPDTVLALRAPQPDRLEALAVQTSSGPGPRPVCRIERDGDAPTINAAPG